jgi:S-adenosylmethionine:tRNA ribosyltransferase-isomerase
MVPSIAEQLTLSDFDFDLPESLIAQEPCAVRDQSRLMALNRKTGVIEHTIFSDIERLLLSGDLLVLNDTKVFSCRLEARKKGG